MGQSVPTARTAFGNGVCWVLVEKPRDGREIAKERRGVDVATSDFGMRGENCLCAIERAVPDRGVDECGSWIFRSGWKFRHLASLSRVGKALEFVCCMPGVHPICRDLDGSGDQRRTAAACCNSTSRVISFENMTTLADKIAVVTGGTAGVGRGVATC